MAWFNSKTKTIEYGKGSERGRFVVVDKANNATVIEVAPSAKDAAARVFHTITLPDGKRIKVLSKDAFAKGIETVRNG